MARVQTVSTYTSNSLQDNWELLSCAPGTYQQPAQLATRELPWLAAIVPGTVVATLQQHKLWDLDHLGDDVDALDWWYRCTFSVPAIEPGQRVLLKCAGLASIADIWLDGTQILHSEDMFCSSEVEITPLLHEHTQPHDLYIRFLSVQAFLSTRRPRPRWRTQLVEQQQLRWLRTTLLGRMPGWSPPIQAVGPWKEISIETQTCLTLEQVQLRTALVDSAGSISVHVQAHSLDGTLPVAANLVIGSATLPLEIIATDPHDQLHTSFNVHADLSVPDVQVWWPHTHGLQPLYPVQLEFQYATDAVMIDCGRVAFRRVEFLHDDTDDFGLRVNGQEIFCRGACWTPLDMLTLTGTTRTYTACLQAARYAGMNMLRIGGTMVYEDDIFYDLCDQFGILIWQDFMFANMDYPTTTPAFQQLLQQECSQILNRLQTHPCLALLCGNSEIEQQIAMLGLSSDLAQNAFFKHDLPALCQQYTDVPYWPSSPAGGALPFQTNVGNSHYQGVGAYLRPLEDARRSEVRFATECLAFANVPEDHTIDLLLHGGQSPVHHARWKARVPRDNGAGWDFEDVRDYYLGQLFHVEPLKLRYSDMQRYLALSRVTTGEVMASVFAEWRRQLSGCHGGLVWFFRDLWPGAGWGVLDSTGYPKAAYYYLRRVLQPQACFFADEGFSGLWLHCVNDTQTATDAELEITLYRSPTTQMGTTMQAITLPAHAEVALHVDALFQHFQDLTYAYRFGPPAHDLVVATLRDQQQQVISETYYFPHGLPTVRHDNCGLQAQLAAQDPDGSYSLTLHTQGFAQSVSIHVAHFFVSDNYFHIQPGHTRTVKLYPLDQNHPPRVSISTLNTHTAINLYAERSLGGEVAGYTYN